MKAAEKVLMFKEGGVTLKLAMIKVHWVLRIGSVAEPSEKPLIEFSIAGTLERIGSRKAIAVGN
jgi:hypothetical protein